jgi:imidazolonepropionase-like amidohydrolase
MSSRNVLSMVFVLLSFALTAHAQEERSEPIALQGARVVVSPGQTLEQATVLVQGERIVAVGTDLKLPPGTRIIPCAGMVIYAGFIDAGNTSLLDPEAKLPSVEPRAVDTSRQALARLRPDDHQGLTPQFLAATALKSNADELHKARQAGFCAVHVAPHGRIVSGQSTLWLLNGLPLRETQWLDAPWITLKLSEPRSSTYPSTMMGVHAHLRQTFLDAERWDRQRQLFRDGAPGVERPVQDPVWEIFAAWRTQSRRALFEVESVDDVERALRLATELQLNPALWGAVMPERWVETIRQRDCPLILTVDFGEAPKTDAPAGSGEFPTIAPPEAQRQARKARWQQRVASLGEWDRAGIRFALSTAGLKQPEELLKSLRQAVEAGLSADAALAALTTHPAALLGVDDHLGRVAPGQLANLVVMTGPWTNPQAKVRYALVSGRRFEYHKDAKPIPTETPAAAPLQLAGTWQVKANAGDPPLQATLELIQTGTRLTGRFQSEQGDGLVTNGQSREKDAGWEVSIGAGDRALVLKFTATRQGEELKGTLKSPFGLPVEWTATKQSTPPMADSGVQLDPVIETADAPVSALHPMAVPKAGEWPIERPEDRTKRHLTTNGNVFVANVTIVDAVGPPLPGQHILIRGGVIAAIGPELVPDAGMVRIEGNGWYAMPGIIDTHSHIMLSNGLGGVNEATHSIVCEVRVDDVINTADPQEYRALAGGVTTIRLLHGSANTIGGQDAVVRLKHGTSAADHRFPGAHPGVKFALGENVKFRTGRFPNTRLGVEATLHRAFVEALEYRSTWQDYRRRVKDAGGALPLELAPRRDLRLEALADILNQERFIHCHCYRADEILMLLRVASQHGLRVWSLQHVLEGYKVAPEIVAHGASCSTFGDWWAYKVEAYDATPYNAALLQEAGANIVLKSDDAELMRHMFQEAAKPVRYGNFPIEKALSLVTLNAAKELGLDDRIGSLAIGKQADIALFNSHPLDTFARCEMTLIAGEPYFVREQQPSVLTKAGRERSTKPAPLNLIPTAERRPVIDWSAVTGPRYALVGGTIHPVDQPRIERGVVLIENGKIASIAAGETVPEGWTAVRVDGLQLYPGLIDAGTTVGLTEIGKVAETHDFAETGLFQPDLVAGVAINPDSELIPVARAGGITTALIRPTGGVICGQASIMQTAGWTAPEMVLVNSVGMQIHWPGVKENAGQIEQLREWLQAARRYEAARTAQPPTATVDPRYEALRPIIRGERPLLVEAETHQHLAEVLKFAELEQVKVILCGATDAWKMADELKRRDVAVIVGPVMRKPIEEYDPFDAPYANAGRLHEAGVRFCIRSNNAANSRNAPFEAGMAVAYGLPAEAALRSITLGAAEILGIADRCGSLTAGKRADLVILDGSPLQVTAQVKGVIVAGQPHRPESRQTRLYEKYRARLQPNPWRAGQ